MISSIANDVIKLTKTHFMLGKYCGRAYYSWVASKVNWQGILKIEFDEAYDNVKWMFVPQPMFMESFAFMWCHLKVKCMQGGFFGVKTNDDIEHYFEASKDLHQGSFISSMSLNIVVDMLVLILKERRIKVKAMVFHPGGSW